MRCQRCTTQTTSCVTVSLNVSRIYLAQPPEFFPPQSLALEDPSSFVSCNFLRQLQFKSLHLPRRATQAVQLRRVPCNALCLSRPIFLPRTTSFLVVQKLLVFDRDDRQRFLESCGLQMNRHHLLQLDGTKLFSKLRHWISPSSYSSYQFARFSFHANSHLVHDLRCKTVKPAG